MIYQVVEIERLSSFSQNRVVLHGYSLTKEHAIHSIKYHLLTQPTNGYKVILEPLSNERMKHMRWIQMDQPMEGYAQYWIYYQGSKTVQEFLVMLGLPVHIEDTIRQQYDVYQQMTSDILYDLVMSRWITLHQLYEWKYDPRYEIDICKANVMYAIVECTPL